MQEMARRTNQQRSDGTRSALVEAARRLFIERTYAGTGTPDLVAAAGVTRGALYHHFADKQALFRAVVEAESRAVANEVEQAAPTSLPPLDALATGGEAYLAAMRKGGRTRLLLIEAPAVLGREDWETIDAAHGGRTLREGLQVAIDAGAMRRLPLDAMTALMSSAYDRAALAIDGGADPQDWQIVLRALIDGLAARAPRSP